MTGLGRKFSEKCGKLYLSCRCMDCGKNETVEGLCHDCKRCDQDKERKIENIQDSINCSVRKFIMINGFKPRYLLLGNKEFNFLVAALSEQLIMSCNYTPHYDGYSYMGMTIITSHKIESELRVC